MVLTEAFAARTPVIASDIPGYRDVVRDGIDGVLAPPGDALALAEALRALALDPSRRARGWPPPRASAPSASPGRTSPPRCSTATSRRSPSGAPPRALGRVGVRHGLAPADLLPAHARAALAEPRARARPVGRAGSASPACVVGACARCWRRVALLAASLGGLALALLALVHIGVDRVAASLLASSPGLLAAGLGADVRLDVRPRDRLARDPRGRPDLAQGQTPRRDAGHVHRRADVRHAARAPG